MKVANVACHSGYDYADRPVSFTREEEHLEIREIIARWRTPESKCFRVRTIDGQIFELSYSELPDSWQIHQP
jgi:hypothetical protein